MGSAVYVFAFGWWCVATSEGVLILCKKGGVYVAKPEKVALVAELTDKFKRGQGIVVADYRGLNVKEMTELRTKLREVGVELQVAKNTLVLRAAQGAEVEGMEELLTGPTVLAYGYDDPVIAAKVMSEFARSNDKLEIKGGVVEGRVIDSEGVKALSELPSREELIAQVLRGFQAPISGLANVLQGTIRKLVYALEAVRQKKEDEAA